MLSTKNSNFTVLNGASGGDFQLFKLKLNMMRLFFTLLAICIMQTSIAQESRSYTSEEEQYLKAIELFQGKHYPASYKAFTDYLKKNKRDLSIIPSEDEINAKLYQALSARFAGKNNAIKLIKHFLTDYPSHPNTSLARLELGKHYFENKEFDLALDNLQQVDQGALEPNQLNDFNMSMGYTYFVKKRFKQAISFLRPLTQTNTNYTNPANYYIGLSYYFQEDYEKALTHLQRVDKDPRYGSVIPFYIAKIYFGQERYQDVISIVEPMITDNVANKAELYQLLGQSYFNLQNFDKAGPYLEAYEKSGENLNPQAIYQLAYTQYQTKQYAEAVKNFEKLNILNDELGQNALYALAQSYLKLNDKQKAKNAFSRAAEMNFNAEIKETSAYNNAKLSYELGRNDEAISLMKAFVDGYPNSSYTAEANEILVDLFLNSNNYKDAFAVLENMPNRSQQMNKALQKVAYYRAVELYNNGDISPTKVLFDKVREYPYDKRLVAYADYWTGELAYEYGRYPLANEYINKYLNSPYGRAGDQWFEQANYTVGYGLYNQKQYQQAIPYLETARNGASFGTDAALRSADAYFALKNYQKALGIYNVVTSTPGANTDYAAYQKAVLKGLLGNNSAKIRDLEAIFKRSPNSSYADDALFEYGRVYTTQENYSRATDAYNQLIRDYPQSEKLKNAYLQLGLINRNQANYNAALSNYDKVVKNYPSTEEAGTALESIKEIYIETGRPDEYLNYVKGVKNVDLSTAEEEKILYASAENQFTSGNCTQATSGFSNYLNRYPRGLYAANAHFYRGECHNQTADNEGALADYEAVLQLPENKFTERALLRSARATFRQSDFQKAIQYYKQLENSYAAAYQTEINQSLMQAYNRTNNREQAIIYAKKLNNATSLDTRVKTEADFLVAYSQYLNKNFAQANTGFQKTAAATRNVYGAEARYYLADIFYQQNQYENAINAAYRVADETPSEDYWVAKSFLLIADVYYAQNELFQSKATLESILENYTNTTDGIRAEAEQKLARVQAQEQANPFINNNAPTDRLQLQDEPN